MNDKKSRSLKSSHAQNGNLSSPDRRAVVVRKLKRVFLPLHRTFKRFLILTGLGVVVFVLYAHLVDTYLGKLRRAQHLVPVEITGRRPDEILRMSNGSNLYGFKKIHIAPKTLDKSMFFLVLSCSSPWDMKHRVRRTAVRESWGNCEFLNEQHAGQQTVDPNMQIFCRQIFFVGRTYSKEREEMIRNEADQLGDILVVDQFDTYRNITGKLLTALYWASQQKFKYLLKTDDDVYVHLPKLQTWLLTERHNLPEDLYGGVFYQGHVVRDPSSKHFVAKVDYAEQWYPAYCKGSQYILSGHLVPRIVEASMKVRRFNIDDAYIGIVLNKLKVYPIDLRRFIQFKFMYLSIEFLHYCDLTWVIGLGDSLEPYHLHTLQKKFQNADSNSSWMCYNMSPIVFYFCFLLSLGLLFAFMIRPYLYSHWPVQ